MLSARRVVVALSIALSSLGCAKKKEREPAHYPEPPPQQGAQAQPTSSGLEMLRSGHQVPALAAAILDSTQTLWVEASGVRRVDATDAVTIGDRWHLGSNTKAMTATLFARLAEKGVIGWEAKLNDVYGPGIHSSWYGVRLVDLLHHQGGAAGNLKKAFPHVWKAMWKAKDDDMAERGRFAGTLLRAPPTQAPGTTQYSNAGYILVGAALEHVTGHSWQQLMQGEVFGPLGMTECGFGPPPEGSPTGHKGAPGGWRVMPPEKGSADNPPTLGPAGTVHCSLESWANFARAHLRGARGQGSGYLSPAAWSRLHTPQGKFALGWAVTRRDWAGGRALTHSGSNTMWYAVIWIAPNRNRAYLAVTNAGGKAGGQAADATIRHLLDFEMRRAGGAASRAASELELMSSMDDGLPEQAPAPAQRSRVSSVAQGARASKRF